MKKNQTDYQKLEQFYKNNKASEQRGNVEHVTIDGKELRLAFESENVVEYSAVGRKCHGKIDARSVQSFVMDASIKLF
ncbi:hypothetical protein M1M34_gp068 [Haloarcula tailed virus 2]|uniref:Uncharacterized protein n=1 Tax=Haloarcula tailed virus 2 TaxID=2877989 RepID=A0AAE8XZ14_9CAUD|nr:hypothetical protein M1M34_gp068 [Haloarcula tailed virus 2]UBF23265.1 hypothetical protein HATV-2_gp114 [Haloarcula tailed virus 2]